MRAIPALVSPEYFKTIFVEINLKNCSKVHVETTGISYNSDVRKPIIDDGSGPLAEKISETAGPSKIFIEKSWTTILVDFIVSSKMFNKLISIFNGDSVYICFG